MLKYITTFGKIVLTLFRFMILKILHPRNFHCSLINVVSPFTEISLNRGAKLTLGKPARIRSGAKIHVRKGANISIGDNTFINHGCMILCRQQITIGKEVQLGPHVLIYDHDHDYRVGLEKEQYKCSSVEIGNNVWIGAHTIILRGTKIGNNCVIGAGSVIKGEYADNTLILQKRETSVYGIEKPMGE